MSTFLPVLLRHSTRPRTTSAMSCKPGSTAPVECVEPFLSQYRQLHMNGAVEIPVQYVQAVPAVDVEIPVQDVQAVPALFASTAMRNRA